MNTSIHDVIAKEKEAILRKRNKLGISEADQPLDDTLLGVALSGGGVRAGVLGLGFLKTLNDMGLIFRTDYLSSVSGGSLASGYLAAKQADGVFSNTDVDVMREGSRTTGVFKSFQSLEILTNYILGFLFSLSSPGIVIGILYYILNIIEFYTGPFIFPKINTFNLLYYVYIAIITTFFIHFIVLIVVPKATVYFIKLETLYLILLTIFCFYFFFTASVSYINRAPDPMILNYVTNVVCLFLIGFFLTPNNFLLNSYPKQFFSSAFQVYPTSLLKNLSNYYDDRNTSAPYFLFNTALSLKNSDGDERFKGGQVTDHFLLSPIFCGSKITGFVPNDRYWDYGRLTLMDAIQISASKLTLGVRPEGVFKLLSPLKSFTRVFGKIFNFNEYIFWVSNPLI